MTRLFRLSFTARIALGNSSSQIMLCRFVFTIWSFRGEECGVSAAPTSTMREVQNSISTIPRAPSSVNRGEVNLVSGGLCRTMFEVFSSRKKCGNSRYLGALPGGSPAQICNDISPTGDDLNQMSPMARPIRHPRFLYSFSPNYDSGSITHPRDSLEK